MIWDDVFAGRDGLMSEPWKLVLIGGEVTVLVALGAVGLHLAVRPHDALVPPPPLVIPTSTLELVPPPGGSAPAATPRPSSRGIPASSAQPAPRSLAPEWLAGLGREDRRQLATQWDVVRRLITAIERYLEERVIPELERRR